MSSKQMAPLHHYPMANCIKTLGAYYGRPTWFEHGQLYQNAKRLLWPSHSMISP
jgi:hypothetical protein